MSKHITLHVHDDIQFMTPDEFDIPTPKDLERERQLAAAMLLWVDEYNERLEAKRVEWLNQPYYDSEGWPSHEG